MAARRRVVVTCALLSGFQDYVKHGHDRLIKHQTPRLDLADHTYLHTSSSERALSTSTPGQRFKDMYHDTADGLFFWEPMTIPSNEEQHRMLGFQITEASQIYPLP